MSIICVLDNDTYIAKDSVAGLKTWVSYASDHYSSDEFIGTEIYLKSNAVLKVKGRSPKQVRDLIEENEKKHQATAQDKLDKALVAIKELRQAQTNYMNDRGNNALGAIVGEKSIAVDKIINEVENG